MFKRPHPPTPFLKERGAIKMSFHRGILLYNLCETLRSSFSAVKKSKTQKEQQTTNKQTTTNR